MYDDRLEIIPDVFSRLHYMDRRASGLRRIMESYRDSEIKPKFYSNESSFTVIFPNKNYFKENMTFSSNVSENIVSDEDYFLINLYKKIGSKVKVKTITHLKELFQQYGFSKDDVKLYFKVKKSRTAEIISMLIENNIIEISNTSMYKFKK